MKLSKIAATGALMAVSCLGAAHADEASPISANIALTTNYMFRGVTQTENNPAIQGGFDYAHESGLYAGIWASNVDFDTEGSIEVDYYVGFSGEVSSLGYDVSYVYYDYPSDEEFDYGELIGSVSYDFVAAAVSGTIAYTDELGEDADSAIYYQAGVEVPVGAFTIAAAYGYWDLKDNADSYNDWSIGVSTEYMGLGLDLTYTDTDIDEDDSGAFASEEASDAHIVFTVSKEF